MIPPIRPAHAFQPIVNVRAGSLFSHEVLLRGPDNQSAGWVFSQFSPQDWPAMDQRSRLDALSLATKLRVESPLNFNFTPSALLFDQGLYVDEFLRHAEALDIAPQQLIVEMTESEMVRDTQALAERLDQLRRQGVSIAVDDFGAGYAGLNLLVEIQPDILKLDMHLVRHIHNHGPRQAIVRAIEHVCLDLGIDIIAEGVESEQEYQYLKALGITLFQGYLFARPGFKTLPEIQFPKSDNKSV